VNNDRPDIGPHIRPDIEQRVAAGMHSLAASHTPAPHPASPVTDTGNPRRWMLAAAASVVLIAGVGAMLVASNRSTNTTDDVADQLPQPAPTVVSDPSESETVLPDVEPRLYSETPLADDIVPAIVPPPAEPINGFDLDDDTSGWTRGAENDSVFALMADGTVIGAVDVFDSAAPWDAIAEGQDVTLIDGHEVIRVEGSDERGFFVRVGDGSRAVIDTSPPAQAVPIDTDIAALVAQIGDDPLDAFVDNEQFVRVPVDSQYGRSIGYGTQGAVQLIQVRLEADSDDDSIDLVEQVYQLLLDGSEADRSSSFVLVSPVDLVVIIASDDEQLATATSNLQLVTLEASGADFSNRRGFAADSVDARGEPSWGRWQVANGSSGDDTDCRYFEVRVWGIDGPARGYSDCGEGNPVRPDGSEVYCVVLDVEVVGAVVGATAEPAFAVGDDITGLAVEVDDTTGGEFGKHTTFRVVQTDPGANIRSATVLVDGVEIDCTG